MMLSDRLFRPILMQKLRNVRPMHYVRRIWFNEYFNDRSFFGTKMYTVQVDNLRR